MKKLTILFAALTLSAGLWAETVNGVKYIDANGQEQTANGVTEITNSSATVTWNAGWYVVTGTDVKLSAGAVCSGAVHLILADGAKLEVELENNVGIQVSGEGNSLTIYGQANQSGQLIVTGGGFAAGIGGKDGGAGSNITINGGKVTATGGQFGAGIGGGIKGDGSNIIINGGEVIANGGNTGAGIGGGANGAGSNITINGGKVTANGGANGAGIGGGHQGSGSNIIINGGTVTATGGDYAAGIGGGEFGKGSNITINGGEVIANGGEDAAGIGNGVSSETPASDIKVATTIIVKAGATENPTEEIATNRTDDTDIANDLAGKQYVTSKTDPWKLAIAEIELAIVGVTSEDILAIADKAIEDINAATTEEDVNSIKNKALADIEEANIYLSQTKANAIAEIELAIVGVTDEDILAIAEKAKQDINAAKNEEVVNSIKTFAKSKIKALVLIQTARQGIQNKEINLWIDGAFDDILKGGPDATPGIDEIKEQIMTVIQSFQIGKEEGLSEAAAALPTDPEGTTGHTVTITKGEKTLILVNPDKVTYGKQE